MPRPLEEPRLVGTLRDEEFVNPIQLWICSYLCCLDPGSSGLKGESGGVVIEESTLRPTGIMEHPHRISIDWAAREPYL